MMTLLEKKLLTLVRVEWWNSLTIEIIKKREMSWMTGSRDEYLCLENLSDSIYELSIRGYEVLGEVNNFMDEDEKISIPEEIDGVEVFYNDGEYIFGETLVMTSDDYGEVRFSDPKDKEVSDWLKSVGWDDDTIKKEIIKLSDR